MRVLAGLAVLGVVAVTAPPAAAAWREQRLASPDATSFSQVPSISTNARGDSAVAWTASPRAFVAVRRAGAARFGRPIELRRWATPRVVVLSDGSVLVASVRGDGTQRGRRPCCGVVFVQRLGPRSRRLSADRAITTRGISIGEWALAAGLRGHAALIGDVDGLTLATSRRPGVFGALAAPSPGPLFGTPFAGFGGDGRGLALWAEGTYGSEQRLMGAPIGRDGRPAAARTLMAAPDPRSDSAFGEIRAGLDGRSRVTAMWLDEGAFLSTPSTVNVATGSIFGLGHRQVLGNGGGLPGAVRDPGLSVAPNGRAIAGWRTFGPGGERTMVAIRSGPRAAFRVLPVLAGDGFGVGVAVLPSGHGILVNGRLAGAHAIVVAPDGGLGPLRSLRDSPSPAHVGVAAVAGRIMLAWGTRRGLRVATYRP